MKFNNPYKIQICRQGKVIEEIIGHNMTTVAGRNLALEALFRGGSSPSSWYLGLINNSPTPTLSQDDTAASHAGWTESTDYAETDRPSWSPGAASGGSVVNGTEVVFTINTTVTLYGYFVISDNAKAGTAGTLYATAAFGGGARTLTTGDELKIVYTATLTQ